MSKFIKNWEGKKESSLSTRIRESIIPPGPLKPRLDNTVKRLEFQIQRLGRTSENFSERDKTIFNSVVEAYMKHDAAHANILANELAEIRKMEKMVLHARLALEQIVLRLSTITELGDVTATITPLISVINGVKGGIAAVSPQVGKDLGEIGNLLGGIVAEAGQVTGITLDFEMIDEDSKKILSEAATVAEQRMRDRFPNLPDYVKETSNETIGNI